MMGDCSCGASYAALRTGETFASVRRAMWVADDDPTRWRSKSRRAVLGFWRELKLGLWFYLHGGCE